MSTLEELNSQQAINFHLYDNPFFKYFICNRFNGDIKGAGASKETLMKNMDVRCWEEYEILTRRQYLTKWSNKV